MMDTIQIDGRILETAEAFKKRVGVSEYYLYVAEKQRGMPAPIKIGSRRWFDRRKVDAWLLTQVYVARSIHAENLARNDEIDLMGNTAHTK